LRLASLPGVKSPGYQTVQPISPVSIIRYGKTLTPGADQR